MSPPPPEHSAPRPPVHGSPVALLADPVIRVIVTTLGEPRAQPVTAPALAERELVGVAPRLVRDRLRVLERSGIVEAVGQERVGSATRQAWALTVAGRDLFSLQSVMARIVAHAARLPATTAPEPRDRLVGAVLTSLSDPVALAILRALAGQDPVDPSELEERCAPTPRRTVYRRLGGLVDGGAVIRSTTREVPRRTTYELGERWRPVVAILLLSSWWELRHAGAAQSTTSADLQGLVLGILPLVRVGRTRDGRRVRWLVDGEPNSTGLVLVCVGTRVRIADPSDDAAFDATVRGTPVAWASALVNDRREDLTIDGDAGAAGELLSAVRAAVLAYVR